LIDKKIKQIIDGYMFFLRDGNFTGTVYGKLAQEIYNAFGASGFDEEGNITNEEA